MFKSKSLNFKLRSSFLLMVLFLILIGGMSIFSLNNVSEKYDHVAKINLQNAISLSQLEINSREILRRLLQFNLPGNSAEDVKRIELAIQNSRSDYDKYRMLYESVPFVPGEGELYEQVDLNWKKLTPLIDKAVVLAKSSTEEDKAKFAHLYKEEMKDTRDQFFKALDSLEAFQSAESKKWTDNAIAEAAFSKKMTLLTLLIGTVAALIIGFKISGNLTVQLRALANGLSQGAADVENASTEIASASEQLSQATTEQAASLEETSASVEEISSMVNQNTEAAKSSADNSNRSLTNAEKGKVVVEQMIHAIGEINTSNSNIMEQINESNKEIEDIVKVISEIGTKTKVINDIVFQTKLLSFNASVEAARAGENGKGFAVVAEEVGNLAQMSGNAAKEITELLDGSIVKVNSIVNTSKEKVGRLIADGKIKVEAGTRIASDCGHVLDEIVVSIASVSKMANEISHASQEQAQGLQEISKAMAQLDQVTQQNTQTTTETANASSALLNQAESLNQIVKDLVATIDGANAGTLHESKRIVRAKKEKPVVSPVASNVVAMKKAVAPPATRVILKPNTQEKPAGIPSNQDMRFEDV